MSTYADLIERLQMDPLSVEVELEAADAISRLEREKAALVEALDSAAARFDHCAEMIAEGFDILGTTRAQHTVKAKHYAIEARQALSRTQEQTA